MHKKLVFNGKSSADMGLVIQTPPVYTYPARDVTTTHIPGRNGDIITDNGCYKNVERVYSIAKGYLYDPINHTIPHAQDIISWLTSSKGKYVRLEDDYDPEIYRLATYVNNGSINDIFDKALSINVTFNCKPQRFLKSGEMPIKFPLGNNINIYNSYHFDAKPKIKIENLPVGNTLVTMLSVKDNDNKETSLLSLKNIEENESVIIDSEKQECINDTGNNINEKVSLNGNDFPVLKDKNNNIKISQFIQETKVIPAYNTLINAKQTSVSSEYSPYETTVASNESKFSVQSFNNLLIEKEKRYSAEAYQSLLITKCDKVITDKPEGSTIRQTVAQTFTPTSFSSMLSSNGQSYTFSNNYDDNIIDDSAWFEISGTASSFNILARKKGFYLIGDSKELVWKDPGSTLQSNMQSQNKNIAIIYYSAEQIDHKLDIDIMANEELPSWLTLEVHYGSYPNYTPDYIKYKIKSGTPNGYVWQDKTWILGKAGWKVTSDNLELNKFTWNKLKKAFTPSGSLSGETNKTYTYRYVRKNNPAQYDFEVGSPELFSIEINNNTDLSQINIMPTKIGYYRYTSDNEEEPSPSDWIEIASTSTPIKTGASSTIGFTIEYLDKLPTYSNTRNWPTWLDSKPYPESEQIYLKDDKIKFKVNQEGWYRFYLSNDEEEYTTKWVKLLAGSFLKIDRSSESESPDIEEFESNIKEGFTVSFIDVNPSTIVPFENDRCFINKVTKEITDQVPPWIDYSISMKIKLDEYPDVIRDCYRINSNSVPTGYFAWKSDSVTIDQKTYPSVTFLVKDTWAPSVNDRIFESNDTTNEIGTVYEEASIIYKVKKATGIEGLDGCGYYKWDNNQAWVYYRSEQENIEILKTGFKDTTTFFWLPYLPQYSETTPGYDKFRFDVVKQEGNPVEIRFIVLEAGYYKLDSSANWKWYNINETFSASLINEITNILCLIPTEDNDLRGIQITITPNWWLL